MRKVTLALVAVVAFMAIAYAAATKFTNVTVTGDLSVEGQGTIAKLTIPEVNVLTSTPTVVGQIVRDSSFKVYISTLTTGVNGWQKVGTQS
jgi:hypothetical protein